MARGSVVMLLMDSQAPRDRNDHVDKILGTLREAAISDGNGSHRVAAPTDRENNDEPGRQPLSQVWGGPPPWGIPFPHKATVRGSVMNPRRSQGIRTPLSTLQATGSISVRGTI
eukprot:15159681-Heterocapsa_arctica.AAC.1